MTDDHLLNETLAASVRDTRTTGEDNQPIHRLPHGAQTRDAILHTDDRGSLFEIFDTDWGFDDEPFTRVYCATLRPGIAKGWALHKEHKDRYFIFSGTLNVILYDVRPDSPTCGEVFVHTLTDQKRGILTIPAFVWHADHNVGETEAMLLNMPTTGYDYENPDKYRLPLDTPLIPYDFSGARGW